MKTESGAKLRRIALGSFSAGLMAACGGEDKTSVDNSEPESFVATPSNGILAVDVGEAPFKDPMLSASGRTSCATCQDELFGHADKPGTLLPLGEPLVTASGMRPSPTGRYLNEGVPFRLEADGTPVGGFIWDGRVDSRRGQAKAPFFEAAEMALPGSASAPRGAGVARAGGQLLQGPEEPVPAGQLDSDAKLFERVVELLEIYQRDDADYKLFDSRYDQWLAGQVALTDGEQRGLLNFRNPAQGHCTSCHSSAGSKPLFTNFGYAALGVPRNHAGPKDADSSFFDLGLCARDKANDAQAQGLARDCGLFKTPTLRKITRSAPYFHSGAVATLEDAILFHFTRDADSARWYRRADGSPDVRYNDLPARYQVNLARGQPFAGTWVPTAEQMGDLLAFLRTLDDADQTEPLR